MLHAIEELELNNSHSELSFITEDNNIKFGGTVDLLTSQQAVDFKTGSLGNKHLAQIAAYAVANNKKQGLILSFNKQSLEKTLLNSQEIATYYNEFTNKARALQCVSAELLAKAETISEKILARNKQIKELELLNNADKTLLWSFLKQEGLTNLKCSVATLYEIRTRETTSLTKQAKSAMMQTNPEFFETKTGKPSFIIRER